MRRERAHPFPVWRPRSCLAVVTSRPSQRGRSSGRTHRRSTARTVHARHRPAAVPHAERRREVLLLSGLLGGRRLLLVSRGIRRRLSSLRRARERVRLRGSHVEAGGRERGWKCRRRGRERERLLRKKVGLARCGGCWEEGRKGSRTRQGRRGPASADRTPSLASVARISIDMIPSERQDDVIRSRTSIVRVHRW